MQTESQFLTSAREAANEGRWQDVDALWGDYRLHFEGHAYATWALSTLEYGPEFPEKQSLLARLAASALLRPLGEESALAVVLWLKPIAHPTAEGLSRRRGCWLEWCRTQANKKDSVLFSAPWFVHEPARLPGISRTIELMLHGEAPFTLFPMSLFEAPQLPETQAVPCWAAVRVSLPHPVDPLDTRTLRAAGAAFTSVLQEEPLLVMVDVARVDNLWDGYLATCAWLGRNETKLQLKVAASNARTAVFAPTPLFDGGASTLPLAAMGGTPTRTDARELD